MKPTLTALQTVLLQTSQALNLFSAGDRLKIGDKHIPDSVAILDFWTVKKGDHVLDIGTGGGLPGLALAVSVPELSFTLLDAREKKVHAVNQMIQELELENAIGLSGRLEELAHKPKYREQFDVATARALAPLPTLLEYAAGFIKKGGSFYAWKGPEYEIELKTSLNAQRHLGLLFRQKFDYVLPSGESRCILRFEKTKVLDPMYPRRVGIPSAKPL